MATARRGADLVDVDGVEVRVTSRDRPMWVGADGTITKGDLVDYYLAVAPALLTALRERPTTLQRFTKGVIIDGERQESFYNKHLPKSVPDYVESAEVTFPSGRRGLQLCPTSAASIIWAANLGCVTFHPWPVRRADVDRPDELRLDLDPQPGTDFRDAVEVAMSLRALLEEMGMTPFAKTSGGRGVHVFCAIEPRWEFLDVRHAAIAIGRELERRLPDRVTTAWWKEERGSRIFIDYNQMARDRTMASAWSVRALAGAPVSTPVPWDELRSVEPEQFTVASVPAYLEEVGNPWAALGDVRASLAPALQMWQDDVDNRGLGEMAFPPDYPKMPGEPPRVQPSRARSDA